MVWKTVALAVTLIAVLGGAAYYSMAYPATTGSTTTSTTSTSCTTATSDSSSSSSSFTNSSSTSTSETTSPSSTSSSTSGSGTNSISGTFTYSPISPVEIDAVTATTTVQPSGETYVTFQVLFTNAGSSPISVLGGCGGGLSSSIQGNSTVLRKISGGPLCDCAAIILVLEDGQNHTSVNPGCWSGYNYELIGHGAVSVNMTLQWSTGSQGFGGNGSTFIQAEFDF